MGKSVTEEPKPVYRATLREMPEGDRPRERLKNAGPGSLSNPELIAILLRTGLPGENVLALASRLLSDVGGPAGMTRASYSELCALKGVSDAKACQIMAALELGKRMASLHPEERPVIRTGRDVFNLLGPEMGVLEQEHLRVVLLNTKNYVLGMPEIYVGSVDTTGVRVAEILRPAVRANCPSVIVVHNHPSGDPSPSPEDVMVTRRIKASAEAMDIDLLDHIIIGSQGHVSLKERGLGF